MKRVFNPEGWNRQEHYNMFSNMDNPYVGIVAEVECSKAYAFAKAHKKSFFAIYLFSSMQAENRVEEFKYRIEDEEIFVYDHLDCGTTIGRKDGTFGFALMNFTEDFETFNLQLQEQIASVESCVGLHIKNEEITVGLVRHSTFPWSRFTGLVQPTNYGTKESIPRIIFGKAHQEGDKMYMPVSVEANHGFVDGLHLAKYLEELEKELGKY
ncbi:chloramphenicol O-acetyltransferase type A [Chishuiella changwenlii]|uniref:Chloramphenicol O-acetyltransferase type A n=1 Tax=Chishuiella changwenlii TaxID=1434701 RepID=A0A1M7B1T2_9FLAO|nr:CatA-like O-acetyltransferase [Chishuiella changwenlii]GGE95570.1 chloramphenicol acetyltransferase [Chishuiella changwenlii]SHL48943.1 chloramphenicol O-acetyltransferase type A [Chishuiella changwenlii]